MAGTCLVGLWVISLIIHEYVMLVVNVIRPKQKIGLFPVGNPSKRRLGRPEWNFFWILFLVPQSLCLVVLMDKSTYTCTLYIYHGKDQCQS